MAKPAGGLGLWLVLTFTMPHYTHLILIGQTPVARLSRDLHVPGGRVQHFLSSAAFVTVRIPPVVLRCRGGGRMKNDVGASGNYSEGDEAGGVQHVPQPLRQVRFHEHAGCAMKLVDDGGVCIQEIRAGSGTRVPRDGDFVYIHYRAFVLGDDRPFDDSRSSEQRNGKPFGFMLGKGEVIQGWEVALRTMTVGQVAMVYVRNAYSYSADGIRLKGLLPFTALNHKRAVPEDVDVRFELELLEFGNGRAVRATERCHVVPFHGCFSTRM